MVTTRGLGSGSSLGRQSLHTPRLPRLLDSCLVSWPQLCVISVPPRFPLKFDLKTAWSMWVSLDKVESSNPNLKAAHAGASTRKTRHLQPNAFLKSRIFEMRTVVT